MFCQNCGNHISDGAQFCSNCGTAVNKEPATEPAPEPTSKQPPVQPAQPATMFCPACGATIPVGLAVCTNCGAALGNANRTVGAAPVNGTQKSKLAAGLLGIFLGGFGVHNFYLGYTGKAIAQIFLTFCFGAGAIWGFIEGILILTGSINKDANGVPLGE